MDKSKTEAWINPAINLLKCLEKYASAVSAPKIHEFRRSFESGRKKYQVRIQFEKWLPQVLSSIPDCYRINIIKEESLTVSTDQLVKEESLTVSTDQLVKEESLTISTDQLAKEESLTVSTDQLVNEESTPQITEEMLLAEEARMIQEQKENEVKSVAWAKWWNSRKFQLTLGTKSIFLINPSLNEQDQKNYADCLIDVFSNLEMGKQLGLISPENYKSQYHVNLVRGATSRKKIKKARKKMKNIDPEYAKKIRNTLPANTLEQMAQDPEFSEVAATLQGNSQVQKFIEKIGPS